MPAAPHARPRGDPADGRHARSAWLRGPGRRFARARHRQEPPGDRDFAAGGDALRDRRGGRELGARRPRRPRHRSRIESRRDRKLRFLRVPRPQPHPRRPALRARARQRARHPLVQAQERRGRASDRRRRRQGIPPRDEGVGVLALHDGARPRLGRLPRGPYPRRPRGTAQRLSHLPLGARQRAGRRRRFSELCAVVRRVARRLVDVPLPRPRPFGAAVDAFHANSRAAQRHP